MRYVPHVTVATVVEDQGRFLLVEEHAEGRVVFNQPAGHLEANESLLEAALRETLEETGWEVELTGLLGIYLYRGQDGTDYQRVCFAARPLRQVPGARLDEGIIGPHWMTREEILAVEGQWRSPMLIRCVDDYRAGVIGPLSLIRPA